MARIRIQVDEGGEARVTCPACGEEVVVTVDPNLLRHSTPIRTRARCGCGWSHAVYLERRAAVRRELDLPAEVAVGDGWRPVMLRNLSRTGVRLELPEDLDLHRGSRVTVRFTLHPGRPQGFEKLAELRWRDGDTAGAEFVDEHGRPLYDGAYDIALALHQE